MSAVHPCAMCGSTNYGKATREHVFPRSWKSEFPWLDVPHMHESVGSGGRQFRTPPNSLFDLPVRPFCGPCNNSFMRDIDLEALPVLRRIARSTVLQIRPEEIEVLQRWAYKTSLVRSVIDEGQGTRAPAAAFHAFRRSGGKVPPTRVRQYVAGIDPRIVAAANKPVVLRYKDGSIPDTVIQEMEITFDRITITTILTHGPDTDFSQHYLEAVNEFMGAFQGAVHPLDGNDSITLQTMLGPVDRETMRQPSGYLLPDAPQPRLRFVI